MLLGDGLGDPFEAATSSSVSIRRAVRRTMIVLPSF